MPKIAESRPTAAPDPVDPGPVGATLDAETAELRGKDSAFAKEFERVAPYEAIARIVVLRRGELGLTQAEVARRMKSTASVVSRIESGRHATTSRTLRRLFEALEGHLIIGAEFRSSDGHPRRDLIVLDDGLRSPSD